MAESVKHDRRIRIAGERLRPQVAQGGAQSPLTNDDFSFLDPNYFSFNANNIVTVNPEFLQGLPMYYMFHRGDKMWVYQGGNKYFYIIDVDGYDLYLKGQTTFTSASFTNIGLSRLSNPSYFHTWMIHYPDDYYWEDDSNAASQVTNNVTIYFSMVGTVAYMETEVDITTGLSAHDTLYIQTPFSNTVAGVDYAQELLFPLETGLISRAGGADDVVMAEVITSGVYEGYIAISTDEEFAASTSYSVRIDLKCYVSNG